MRQESRKFPALRFPEFSESWEFHQLGEVIKISSGGTPDRTNQNYWNGNIPWITTTLIDFKVIIAAEEYISNLGLKNSAAKIFPAGTVLMAMYGQGKTRGQVGILGIEAATNQACAALLPDKERIDEVFLFQNLAGRYSAIRKLSNSGGQDNLSAQLIRTIGLAFPSLSEQKKIATFLTAVDKKIEQLARKRTLLLKYKKAVMQQIFNQKIRFKDDNGNNFRDWETTELKEVSQRVKLRNRSEEISLILTNSASMGIVNQSEYFDNNIANPNNLSGYYIVDRDDFVYNPRISTAAPVGPIKRNRVGKGVMSPLYLVFRLRGVNPDFFEYFFETNVWHEYMRSIANFGARYDRMNITTKDFFQMPVWIPSLAEQKKISRCLRAFDDKIDLANQHLEKMKTFKKGLLQQMFV